MLPSPNLPEPNALARLLGLNDWRVGVHRFSDALDLWAYGLWWVEVQPSFHPHWVIAGVTASEWREKAPVWRKAILAQDQAAAVIDLRDAAIEEAFNAAPLLHRSMGMSLDGIGYAVRTESVPVTAEFRFANPEVAERVAVERALRDLSAEIAKASGSAELADVMKLWRLYTSGR